MTIISEDKPHITHIKQLYICDSEVFVFVCLCVCKEKMEIDISEWASCTAIRCRKSQLEAFGTSSNRHRALRLHSFAQQKSSHPRFDIGSLQVSNMAMMIGIVFAVCTKRFWLKSAMIHKNYL